jgi:hypothetical protein
MTHPLAPQESPRRIIPECGFHAQGFGNRGRGGAVLAAVGWHDGTVPAHGDCALRARIGYNFFAISSAVSL